MRAVVKAALRLPTLLRLASLALLVAFLVEPTAFAFVFAPLTTSGAPAIYVQTDLLALALNHLALVAAATGAATVVALGLAILVTRPFGAEFLPLSRSIANIGQTFPPIAVLALTVPVFGFGSAPIFVALFLYGLLPILENTLTGLTNIPATVREAALGMGMTGTQRLVKVELPLALPLILAGIRLSVVISLATATIGSTVAANTLGEVIIAGLLSNNLAFVLQGGLVVAVLAVLIYDGFIAVERLLERNSSR
jgi:osmoprotectant transport system permease protein